MQRVTSFTMFGSYHVGLFTLQTRDFEKIQDGPQCVKRCIFFQTHNMAIDGGTPVEGESSIILTLKRPGD